ncbi:hypothetical protein CfE428DRAFT_6020 [Chthoniobacter flavus Ellin428]|uniref:Uncharacterized protein n=1 Tax=Chthoniobacter flavus Ellin428 TaxID=497964 RepID=B4DAS9_9BACT|nr:hypothetical protein CfE428DRAFT_6020 [Chthoniobacter flavus Ellin428]TCO92756.1 hypothetical protein EV701_10533 [Chthoniobacter flavus]
MSYHVVTRWGDSENGPTDQRMREILGELDMEDVEHPDCWLTHETGWTLSISAKSLVTYENPESDGEPRHLTQVPRSKAFQLWKTLAAGDLAKLEEEPWQPGSHPPLSEEELRARRDEAERIRRELDRQFYDSLGDERPDLPCRHEGCPRGSIQFSVFCRPHHFESLYRRPCPFQH